MESFPTYSEGQLSKLKAHLVSANHLYDVAQKVNLGAYLLLGRGEEMSGGREKKTLLANAVEASESGGQVKVAASASDEPPEVRIAVEDNGPGIPEGELERVFEPFYRLEESRSRGTGGTGLGLNIARNLVERHGGRIWVESRPGQGATFFFTLPAATAGARTAP